MRKACCLLCYCWLLLRCVEGVATFELKVPWKRENEKENLLVVPSASGWGVAELESTVRWELDIVGVVVTCV